jgi:uncharacterized CHY-type Zn-finger protein
MHAHDLLSLLRDREIHPHNTRCDTVRDIALERLPFGLCERELPVAKYKFDKVCYMCDHFFNNIPQYRYLPLHGFRKK